MKNQGLQFDHPWNFMLEKNWITLPMWPSLLSILFYKSFIKTLTLILHVVLTTISNILMELFGVFQKKFFLRQINFQVLHLNQKPIDFSLQDTTISYLLGRFSYNVKLMYLTPKKQIIIPQTDQFGEIYTIEFPIGWSNMDLCESFNLVPAIYKLNIYSKFTELPPIDAPPGESKLFLQLVNIICTQLSLSNRLWNPLITPWFIAEFP